MKSELIRNLCAIVALNIKFNWYCTIRRRPDLFIPVLNREIDELSNL